jgi:hypothetical protein
VVAIAAAAAMPGYGAVRIKPIETIRSEGSRAETLHIRLPEDGIAVTHGGKVPFPVAPPGVPMFTEESLRRGFALLVRIRDADGRVVGMAAELEVHPVGDMLSQSLEWDTDWILVLPGRGMLVLHEVEHSNDLGSKVIHPTLASGQDWVGDWTVQTTVGPGPAGEGVIIGGTGEFTGSTGTFVEVDRLTRFSVVTGLHGHVELRLERRGP